MLSMDKSEITQLVRHVESSRCHGLLPLPLHVVVSVKVQFVRIMNVLRITISVNEPFLFTWRIPSFGRM